MRNKISEAGFTIIVTYLVIYLVYVPSFLYLKGFWNVFDINFYEYIDLSQILKFNIYTFWILTAAILFILFFIWNIPKKKYEKNISNELQTIIDCLTENQKEKLAANLKKLKKESEETISISVIFLIAWVIIIAMPWGFYKYGECTARNKVKNSDFILIEVSLLNKKDKYRYLGKLNDHYFFLPEKQNEVIIVDEKDLISIQYLKK